MTVIGETAKLWEYGIGNSRIGAMAEKNVDGSFVEIAAAKAAGKVAGLGNVERMGFKDMWQTRFPGAYYHSADASNIPQGIWKPTGAATYMGESYEERISKITDKTAASAFRTAYAMKMAGATDYISTISRAYSTGEVGATNFEDAFPMYDVITHVGNANISSGKWQRNDFPFWKYFDRNTSADALNDWKPEGANPSQMRSDLQRNYNSVGSGRIAILVPESLQQKMDADPAFARQIMEKLQAWKEDYDRWDNTVAASYGYNVAEFQAGKSYVFDLDENGDVRNCTVTGAGRITVSSSEFVEERKKREARHAEFEKLAAEKALKRKLLEKEDLL